MKQVQNQYNIPPDQWNLLTPEQREFTNSVLKVVYEKKEGLVRGVQIPQTETEQIETLFDRTVQTVVLEAAISYGRFIPEEHDN